MKSNLGYDMRVAENTFFNACDGTHILHLVEVFERPGVDGPLTDTTRQVGDVEDAGELWMLDEDGYDEITKAEWVFEGREAVGFDRSELEEMNRTGLDPHA